MGPWLPSTQKRGKVTGLTRGNTEGYCEWGTNVVVYSYLDRMNLWAHAGIHSEGLVSWTASNETHGFPSLPADLFLSDRGEVRVLFEAVCYFLFSISILWFSLRHSQMP